MKIIDDSGGSGGYLSSVEIDTAHFKGNFPESCELHAINSPDLIPPHQQGAPELSEGTQWGTILPRTKLGPHKQHFFQLQNVDRVKYTHVMLTIHPDGGIKRVRVVGTQSVVPGIGGVKPLDALPLTPEGFATFGQVVQGYRDLNAVPRGVRLTGANQGSALKFHKLSLLESSYPADVQATTGLSMYRCQPIDAKPGGHWDVKVLERHLHTNQGFIPMGVGSANEGEGLGEAAKSYLVVVAQNGKDDKPDLETMRAFIAASAQGIVYNTGIWRKSYQTPSMADKAKLEDQITPWRCWGRYDLADGSDNMLLLTFRSRWTSLALRHRSVMEGSWIARSWIWIRRNWCTE